MNNRPLLHRDTISVQRVIQVLQSAARSGVEIPSLLLSCGIARDLLENPEARIDRLTFVKLLLQVMEQTEDEFAGLGQGRKSKPGTFSMMAHAVINCATLGDALRRGLRFYDMFDLQMTSHIQVANSQAMVVSEAGDRLDFRGVILEALFLLTYRFMGWLVGTPLRLDSVEFDFADSGAERLGLFDCPVSFDMPANRLIFSAEWLDMPLAQNELSLSRFLKASLYELLQGGKQELGLPARIRTLLSQQTSHSFPDFSEVCGSLNMTPQTLRRRLKDSNTSYQQIKDAIREEASIYYLAKLDLSIDEIALLMGFSEASSFHRAFKKWTGQTPSHYRHEHFLNTGS